jgi:hypothetical protein
MKSLFLHLIHPVPPIEKLKIDKECLLEILPLALRHNLMMLVYSQLQKHYYRDKAMSDYLDKLKPLYLKEIARTVQQETIENELTSLLKERGIPLAVIGEMLLQVSYTMINTVGHLLILIFWWQGRYLLADSSKTLTGK